MKDLNLVTEKATLFHKWNMAISINAVHSGKILLNNHLLQC